MLIIEHLCDLTLQWPTHTPGHKHLSAASGLVCAHGRAYVVADDEHGLAVFGDARTPGRTVPLFEGQLPAGKVARKQRKPDTETLLLLPASRAAPHGALLTLGSGSRPQRCRAVCIALGPDGEPLLPARRLDLAALYEPLLHRFGDLNIEGAFISQREFVLLQRGHRGGSPNASLHYALAAVLRWLHGSGPAPAPQRIRRHRLGTVNGVALTFTDGAALADGRWVFTAVAEATDDSVADGACVGSAVGVMTAQGTLQALFAVPGREKVEGIAARQHGRTIELCLVTDADDPRIASRLLRGRVTL
jgi:hypothetical protein